MKIDRFVVKFWLVIVVFTGLPMGAYYLDETIKRPHVPLILIVMLTELFVLYIVWLADPYGVRNKS